MAGAGWSTLLISGPPGGGEGDMSYLMEGKKLRYLSLPELGRELRPLRDLRAAWKILRCLLREEPLVLHTHTAKAGAIGRLAAVLYRHWGEVMGEREVVMSHVGRPGLKIPLLLART
jgi:hypothetical protein